MARSAYVGRKLAPGGIVRLLLVFAFVAAVVWLGMLAYEKLDETKAQTWLTVAAVVVGGLYFSIRLIAGEFWSGVSLRIELQRAARVQCDDLLGITAHMRNERATSVILYSAVAVVRSYSRAHYTALGAGFHRYQSRPEQIDVTLQPAVLSSSTRLDPSGHTQYALNDFLLNPGDDLSIVGVTEVAPGEPVTVDVVLIGRAYLGFVQTQWVSSAVTLPLTHQDGLELKAEEQCSAG